MKLTAKQQAFWDAFLDLERNLGCPPTLREMQQRMGYKSFNAARQVAVALTLKGLLRHVPGQSRNFRRVQ